MVDGKRGFDALIGSWSLVKDRWWSIFGKILLIGLLCGLVAMIAEIVSVIFFVIAFGLATILHLEVLLIIFGVLFGIALIGALVVLVYPLLMLVYFELYFNAKESRIVSNAADTSKHKSRKTILVVFMIIGALIFMVMPFLWKIQSQILGTSSIDKFSFYKQINEQNSMNVQTNSADTTAANSFSNPGFPVINSIYPAIAEVGNTITITGYNFVPLGMSSTTDLTEVRLTNGNYSAVLWVGIPSSAQGNSQISFVLPSKLCLIPLTSNAVCPSNEQTATTPGNYKIIVDTGGRGSSNEVDLNIEVYY